MLVFDGHNDVLLRLWQAGGRRAVEAFATGDKGHIDLPRAREGGFGGGFFAIFVPSPEDSGGAFGAMVGASYDLPLPEPIKAAEALPVALGQAAILIEMEHRNMLRICRSTADIRACLAKGTMAAIMHMEGAEAIDRDFHALDVLHTAGLRSLGPVWSRPNVWGEGVPFRFPSDGNTGGGLTEAGKELIRACNARRIMVDLSHMTEAGFWDVAAISDAPLVATHSNAHALCASARNLTDRQLAAIAESGGMVGLNFATAFLREDGQMQADTPLETMLRHLDHLIGILGEDGVGLGSDFDGAQVPGAIGDVAGLPALIKAMRRHQYGEALVEKLCHGNWLRVLKETWG